MNRGGVKCSPETRKRMSEVMRARYADPAFKERWKAAVAAKKKANPPTPRRASLYFAAGPAGDAFRDRWAAVSSDLIWSNGFVSEPKRAKEPSVRGRHAA